MVEVVLATIGVAFAIVYVPWLASIFKASPLPSNAWLYIVKTSIVALGIQVVGKSLSRRLGRYQVSAG